MCRTIVDTHFLYIVPCYGKILRKMTLISEKIVVTAKELLSEKNINDCLELNEPMFQAKLAQFNWDLPFASASLTCEIIWKIAIGRNSLSEWSQLDKLFSPSPIATHSNFRGCRDYKTGNIPELGALAFWKRGNSWQGHMGVVISVSEDKTEFDIIDGRILTGSDSNFIQITESKGKKTGLPFKNDKLNLMGFVYPKNREIS